MQDVSLLTSESDIKPIYGLIDFELDREAARTSLKYILADMTDIKQTYFRLGFHLNEFKNNEYYKDFGFSTFEEFCEKNFDMDKGGVSRCINVYLMTTSAGETTYRNGVKSVGCGSVMSDKYKDYSYSQLCEMLPLDDKRRSMIKPDMTVREIREFKNKITDIAPEKVKDFVELFRGRVPVFTRGALIEVFEGYGKRYSSTYGGKVEYDFKPGKVRLSWSEYYSFSKILDYYEQCGGEYEEIEVATSQSVYKNPVVCFSGDKLGSSEFVNALWDKLEEVVNSLSEDIFDCKRSGKLFVIETLSGEEYRLLYMVGKKKEEQS